MKIGLLGGSFNPPHAGHLHLSKQALTLLGLDRVWWLIAEQHPFKPHLPASRARAEAAARLLQPHRRILPVRLEAMLPPSREGHHYTYRTLEWLTTGAPKVRFVWLMGADNFATFHRWKHPEHILATMPIAVFDRAPHLHRAMRAKTALRWQSARVPFAARHRLTQHSAPAWCLLPTPRHPAASRDLRRLAPSRKITAEP